MLYLFDKIIETFITVNTVVAWQKCRVEKEQITSTEGKALVTIRWTLSRSRRSLERTWTACTAYCIDHCHALAFCIWSYLGLFTIYTHGDIVLPVILSLFEEFDTCNAGFLMFRIEHACLCNTGHVLSVSNRTHIYYVCAGNVLLITSMWQHQLNSWVKH